MKEIAKLMTLLNGGQLPIDVEDIDDEDAGLTYDIDGGDMAYMVDGEGDPELEFEDVDDAEDDGELGFEIPQFTWLPDGWTITSTEADRFTMTFAPAMAARVLGGSGSQRSSQISQATFNPPGIASSSPFMQHSNSWYAPIGTIPEPNGTRTVSPIPGAKYLCS